MDLVLTLCPPTPPAGRCVRALRGGRRLDPGAVGVWPAARRWASSDAPRITTHYSIRPRDQDPRWEGKNRPLRD